MKPRLDPSIIPAKSERPQLGRSVPAKQQWTFSLKYWREIDNFGLGDQRGSWFVSLCGRLADLCGMEVEEFIKDTSARDNFRFHEIDWEAKNIPLRRQDFDWIPKEYLNNNEEYPFFQFHVSKAMGRVVGFFDERNTFNVLLFDPNHNIQPSKYSSYKIRPTSVGQCNYSILYTAASRLSHQCSNQECSLPEKFETSVSACLNDLSGGIVICRLTDEYHEKLRELRENGKISSIDEIIELGLISLT
ncbi:hypothetical protein [Brucella intermedia]|uniref:hypothetical protein n=1 Tax=Brucella intermedia TaxID=94625 RepID=UPI0013AF68FA|nr:hypothetical protein [Brucella intermedia]WGJ09650.1 hypothetical protein QBQ48_17095 [Brucella intermedia]